jgi:transcriptional regulator with XRE-family HTH domain
MVVPHSDPLINALAKVLRRHRQAAGLSQEELAFRAGRSMRYISLLESCRHQPTLDTLKKLSDGLNISLGSFVTEIEAEATTLERRS